MVTVLPCFTQDPPLGLCLVTAPSPPLAETLNPACSSCDVASDLVAPTTLGTVTPWTLSVTLLPLSAWVSPSGDCSVTTPGSTPSTQTYLTHGVRPTPLTLSRAYDSFWFLTHGTVTLTGVEPLVLPLPFWEPLLAFGSVCPF